MSSSERGAVLQAPFEEFRGRRVLVTGASSGIGAAVGTAFAELGAHVCLHYGRHADAARDLAATLRERGCAVETEGSDLALAGAAQRLVVGVAAKLGGLDILVNVAGAPFGRVAFESLDDRTCDNILQVNLRAVIDGCRAALPHLRQATHPAIINTSSIAARSGGARGVAVYAAAKAGVEALTRSLAKEMGPAGIRVNAVSPGYIETPIHDGLSTDDDRRAYIAATPLGRGGTTAECTGAYLFLACHRLSAFITGQTIGVNGGLVLN
jgi:3-oxoacyl-[acyl-carrier protein] reductase